MVEIILARLLTQGWSLFPIVTWRTGVPIDVAANLPDAFNNGTESTSGVGDPFVVRANVVGPLNTFDPRSPRIFNGTSGNYYFNPASFSNARCGDNNNPLPCTPGPTLFPSDAQVVANPSLSTYGSLPRNFLRGPGRTNFDLALSKTTLLRGERLKLEFRAEFFNLPNHTNFLFANSGPQNGNNATILGTQQFGNLTAARAPRQIQFALKFSF